MRSARVFNGPRLRSAGKSYRVVDHHLGNFGVLGVLGVGNFEEHPQREEGGLDGLDGRPVCAQSVEANSALFPLLC